MDKIAINAAKTVKRYVSGTSGAQRIDRIHNALDSMGKAVKRRRDTKGGVAAVIRKVNADKGFMAALDNVPETDRSKYVAKYLN